MGSPSSISGFTTRSGCFSRVRSLYFITLGEAPRRVQPAQFTELMIEQEWVVEPRPLSEIVAARWRLPSLRLKVRVSRW